MKINFLGHSGLLVALQHMVLEREESYSLNPFTSFPDYVNGDYGLLILDSQYFKSIIAPNFEHIYTYVLILGHYTDTYTQQAFCFDERFTYMPYSQVESQLSGYLDYVIAE